MKFKYQQGPSKYIHIYDIDMENKSTNGTCEARFIISPRSAEGEEQFRAYFTVYQPANTEYSITINRGIKEPWEGFLKLNEFCKEYNDAIVAFENIWAPVIYKAEQKIWATSMNYIDDKPMTEEREKQKKQDCLMTALLCVDTLKSEAMRNILDSMVDKSKMSLKYDTIFSVDKIKEHLIKKAVGK